MTEKTTSFDKATIREIREAVNEALSPVAMKYGIAIRAQNASYTGTNVTMKIEMSLVNSEGQTQTREVQDFERCAYRFGLVASDFGRVFEAQGSMFKISGLRVRASKKPIVATRTRDGKAFIFSSEAVKRYLEKTQ